MNIVIIALLLLLSFTLLNRNNVAPGIAINNAVSIPSISTTSQSIGGFAGLAPTTGLLVGLSSCQNEEFLENIRSIQRLARETPFAPSTSIDFQVYLLSRLYNQYVLRPSVYFSPVADRLLPAAIRGAALNIGNYISANCINDPGAQGLVQVLQGIVNGVNERMMELTQTTRSSA
jgi:hypothetical protein